ncbi:hypothetical protein C8R43DRAFT_953475 [Mycena crocata]|nr:hypothetical protein C8R43DRAFT_953475 [Mycena crocata]
MALDKENIAPAGTTVLTPATAAAKPAKAPRAVWNTATVAILIDTLLAQKAEGNQTDNAAWKADAWTACAEALAGTESGPNGSGGPPKTAKMCSTRWVAEKGDYIMVKSLRDKSGWGWDDEKHIIVVDDNVWNEFVKTCPNAKKWHTKPFPFYDKMVDLVDGGVATGNNSFVPGREAPNDDEDDFPLDPALQGEGGMYPPPTTKDPIDWPPTDNESDKEEIRVEPPQSTRKRIRAISDSSPTSSASTGKRQHTDGHGHKPSAGHAMFAISESLKEVANALSRDPGGPSSPQRKPAAIAAVMKMNLDNAEKVRALQLIRSDTSVADVLLAFEEDDPMRKEFLLAEIGAHTHE